MLFIAPAEVYTYNTELIILLEFLCAPYPIFFRHLCITAFLLAPVIKKRSFASDLMSFTFLTDIDVYTLAIHGWS